jgi:hypothetical protein
LTKIGHTRYSHRYTFLKTAPRGMQDKLLRYEQWNIDEASVVSFASMAFKRG